ncbi:MAG TPA: DUF1638 domain-containing protein [Methanomethylovorans sp.]|uniref:DUF1638 domain-containing protein n=2 Tax=Methanomethylovorans sp. TaxID=2758717 RepID=UPI002C86A632|nr:DUF1638 domain-containing protein [Methanomethylovorans sp.]
MTLMSIIACRIFEDEIVHLIKNDSQITRILVVDSLDAAGILRKLSENAIDHTVCSPNKIEDLIHSEQDTNYCLLVNILGFSLDASPQLLKESVYKEISIISEYADTILIFYGLCGNVLGNLNRDFAHLSCPVHILREEDGEIIDDCIGASLGGRKPYLRALKEAGGEGVYFLTPMGAAFWKEMAVIARLTNDPENTAMTKIVFDHAGYKNVGKINTGLVYEESFDAKVEEFAQAFDFRIVDMQGTVKIAEQSYQRAKDSITKKRADFNET